MQLEIERKWEFTPPSYKFLSKKYKKVSSAREEDEYYFAPELIEASEFESFAIRIRRRKGRTFFQLKGVRDEFYETSKEVDPETAQFLAKVLEQMGMRKIAVVKKSRETFKGPGVKVTVDDVDGLGQFVEVESTQGSLEDVLKVAKEAGLETEVKQSYLTQLLQDSEWEQFFVR